MDNHLNSSIAQEIKDDRSVTSFIHPPMTASNPTRGQLERTLSQSIQALYRNQLGHQPSRVVCQILDEKIVIVLENSITPPEQVLLNNGKQQLAQQVRSDLDAAMDQEVRNLIQQVVGIPVIDLLMDATLETGRSGTIAILDRAPTLRSAATPVSKSAQGT